MILWILGLQLCVMKPCCVRALQSHHKPREGPFEMNDVFAIINAVPAISLMAYGFFNSGLVPGLCFGAGLGITMFGMAYMFVHDGLVHRRFPVGPIADVPYLQKVAAAHQVGNGVLIKTIQPSSSSVSSWVACADYIQFVVSTSFTMRIFSGAFRMASSSVHR